MNVVAHTLVSSRGLANLAHKKQMASGTVYRPFDRPSGSPLFIASQYIAADTAHPILLRLVRSTVLGNEPAPYGVLEVCVEPASIPADMTLAVPRNVTASLNKLEDVHGHSTVVDKLTIAEGSLLNNNRMRFQWVLDSAMSADISASLKSELQLFKITVSCVFDAVNVDRLTVGSEPEPDIVPLEVLASVDLASSIGSNSGVLIDEEEVASLPDGNWRVEIDSVLSLPIAGIRKMGVQITAPANPPRRVSTVEATAWLESLPVPLATLRLLPLEQKSGSACVVAMVDTASGVDILKGPERPHSGSMFLVKPADLPVHIIQLRAEAALLSQAEILVDVVDTDEQTLYSASLDSSGATFASTTPADMNLVARIVSLHSGEVAISAPWPFRNGVVDRAWFSGFGAGTATIELQNKSERDIVELYIRLSNQPENKAHIVQLGAHTDAGQWRYLNTGPFTPQYRYRVSENGSTTTQWSEPLKVGMNMFLTKINGDWQLKAGNGSSEVVPHETDISELSGAQHPDNPGVLDETDIGAQPIMEQLHTETINGIECRWHENDKSRFSYKPPAILPVLNTRGEPLISMTIAGGTVSVQVSAEWTLPAEELLALRTAFATRNNVNDVLVSMSVVDVGPISAELVSVDEEGRSTTLATTPTSGFGSHAAALNASDTQQNTHTSLSAAFSGISNRLLIKYTAMDLKLTADLGQWIANSNANHIITIPGQ